MKTKLRTILAMMAFAAMLMGGPVFAGAAAEMYLTKVINAETVVASGTYTSTPAIDLQDKKMLGYFALQVTVTGSGTCKFEALVSINGTDYMEPSTFDDIASGFTASSGPGSDGKGIYKIDLKGIIPRQIKIKVTETGTSDSVIVNAWISYQ